MTEETALTIRRPDAVSGYIPPPDKSEFEAMISMANTLAKAQGFLPAHFFGQPYKILAAILYGRDLGISATNALQHIIVIEGKATADAQLIGMLVRRAGHRLEDVTTDRVSTVKITRGDDGSVHEFSFGMDDAQRAGIARSGSAWTKFPKAMLYARALTGCARKAAQDALMGTVYTPEEVGAQIDDQGEVVLPPDGSNGEIPLNQASPTTQAAVAAASVEVASVWQKPEASDPAKGSAQPPPTRSGPRAKRGNVVSVPASPTAGKVAPELPPSPVTQAPPVPRQDAPPALTDDPFEAADPGEEAYLNSLREDLRYQAALLARANVLLANHEAALKGGPLEEVTPAEPNPIADGKLARLIERDYSGQTLATLDEAGLQNRLDLVEASLKRKRQQLKERGISE